MACRFTELVIDCGDPEAQARFWAEVLDYTVTERSDDWVFIQGPTGSGPGMTFAKVPEPKTVNNRLHIDVNPTERDQGEEVERISGLGATPADGGRGDLKWVVLADPEGNEF